MKYKGIERIDDDQRLRIRLSSNHGEYVIIDMYILAKQLQELVLKNNMRFSQYSMLCTFEDNEHDLITNYFSKKITLNDLSIEDIIDIEDAFEEYIVKVYCKNIL